jgi:hypothetical protein
MLKRLIGIIFKINFIFMDYTKELLLSVATIFVSTGVAVIQSNIWQGTILLLIGVAVFIGRGFYKKYLDNK